MYPGDMLMVNALNFKIYLTNKAVAVHGINIKNGIRNNIIPNAVLILPVQGSPYIVVLRNYLSFGVIVIGLYFEYIRR
jgi:hypothetical protein